MPLTGDKLGLYLHSRAKSTCGRDAHIMDNEHLGRDTPMGSPRHILFGWRWQEKTNNLEEWRVHFLGMTHAQFLMEAEIT